MSALPTPANRFVGREAELASIAGFLERRERLLTIVGPPGIGKTRLAREFLRRSAPTWNFEWQCLCDLSEIRDASELPASIAQRLDIDVSKHKTAADAGFAVGKALVARGRGVLLLDNVEQIAGATAHRVEEWLEAADDLVIVTTSRERLRAKLEVCFELGPLGLPRAETNEDSEALTLFVDRALAHDPRFRPGPADIRHIEKLVGELDGIPLAIELAAARASVMNLEELRSRVSTGIEVLSRSTRSAPRRQATLRNAVQWSWDLLSPVEQNVLSRCSVFRGGFELGAAGALLEDSTSGAQVLEVLHALRDRSMLRVQGDAPRFSLSFGIREFAAERLESAGLAHEVRTRHARIYLDLAGEAQAELERTGRADAAEALVRERGNLVATYEWLEGRGAGAAPAEVLGAIVALAPVLLSQGPVDRLIELVEQYLGRSDARAVDAALYSRGLQARARALQLSGSLDAAERDFDAALTLMPADADRWQAASLLVDAGVLHHQRRHLEQARDCYTRALDLYESGKAERQRARVLGNIGALHHDQREFEVAEKFYRRALRLVRRVDEPRLSGNILANLGLLSTEAGRLEEADALLERAETALARSSDGRLLGIVRGNRGALALERGELETARCLLGAAIGALAALGDSTSQALCLARHAASDALSGKSDWRKHSFAAEQLIDPEEDPLTLATVKLYTAVAELASLSPPSIATVRRARELVTFAHERRTEGGQSLADLSDDARAALRLLAARLAELEPLSGILSGIADDVLVIGPEGTWFRPPGGVSQSLGSHGPIRRILLALSARQVGGSRQRLTLDELRQIGWPGEKIQNHAAANRVHVALAELRRRGLKASIVRLSNGYALSDLVDIVESDVPFPDSR